MRLGSFGAFAPDGRREARRSAPLRIGFVWRLLKTRGKRANGFVWCGVPRRICGQQGCRRLGSFGAFGPDDGRRQARRQTGPRKTWAPLPAPLRIGFVWCLLKPQGKRADGFVWRRAVWRAGGQEDRRQGPAAVRVISAVRDWGVAQASYTSSRLHHESTGTWDNWFVISEKYVVTGSLAAGQNGFNRTFSDRDPVCITPNGEGVEGEGVFGQFLCGADGFNLTTSSNWCNCRRAPGRITARALLRPSGR